MGAPVDLSHLELRVTAEPGVRELIRYDAAAARANRSSELLDRAVAKLSGVFAALSLARAVTEAVQLADNYANLNARLALVSRTSGELAATQAKLFAIAQQSQQAYAGVATLYTRVARAGSELGASSTQLIRFTEGVSLALKVSGASAESSAGALLQLSQAMSSGIVRAEEYNSILEGAPRILQAVADGYGETGLRLSELRAKVIEGSLTSRQFFEAFQKGMVAIQAEAAALPQTVGGAFVVLQNAVQRYVGEADKAHGVTTRLAGSITTLATHLDDVVSAAEGLAVIFGARFLAGGVAALQGTARSLVVARAETLAYAESSVRTATANATVAASELKAAIARQANREEAQRAAFAERQLLQARLATANARLATAAAAVANPAGSGFTPREALAAQAIAAQQAAKATNDLARAGQLAQEVNRTHAASMVALGAAERNAAAAAGAVTVAQTAMTAATSRAAVAMAVASRAATAMWAAIGGIPGAILIGLYGIYKLFIDQSSAIEAARARAEKINEETSKYAATLSDMTTEALKAAAAQERLNLAQLGGQILAAEEAVKRAKTSNVNTNYGGIGQLGAGPLDNGQAARDLAEAHDRAAVAAGRLAAITAEQTDRDKALLRITEDLTKSYNKQLASSQLMLARQRALNAAVGQSDEAIQKINDAFDLKAKFAAIDAEYTGKQAAALKALAAALATAEQQGRALNKATQDAKTFQDAYNASLLGNLALDERYAQEQLEARRQLAERSAEQDAAQARETNALRAQLDAFGKSRAAYDALLIAQQADEAVRVRRLELAKVGLTLSDEEAKGIRQRVVEYLRLKAVIDALSSLGPNATLGNIANANVVLGTVEKKTVDWADSLQKVVGVVQLVASAFGNVGEEIAKAATGAQSLIAGLEAASKLKGRDGKTSISLGTALSGSEGLGAFASGLSVIGQFVAGAKLIADAFGIFDDSAQRAREGQIAYTKAVGEYAVVARTALETQLRENAERTNQAAQKAFAAVGATGTIAFGSSGELQRQIEILQSGPGVFRRLGDELAKLLPVMQANEAAITARIAAEEKVAVVDAGIRLLRANGLTEEAEAAAQAASDAAELDAAIQKFGEGSAAVLAIQLAQMAEAAKRAADAIAEAARKAEEERRNIFDYTNRTLAFSDPRSAAQAAFDEEAMRRYNDAVARGASAAELAAIQLYNLAEAADRAKQIAEQDLRTQEGFVARVLSALGNTRGAEDASLAATQRQALVDAVRDGMSPSNLALLRFTQLVERSQLQMQRAIEDGTKAIQEQARNELAAVDVLIEATRSAAAAQIKAIDDQIKVTEAMAKVTAQRFDEQIAAIREQTKAQLAQVDAQIEGARAALSAAQAQVSALDRQIATNLRVVEALDQFSKSLLLGDLSPLSPGQKLEEARAQFERLAAAAQGGDSDSATNIPAAAQAFLQASRLFNASGAGFGADTDRVRAIVESLTKQFGATLPIDQQQLNAARDAVARLEATLVSLGNARDLIQSTSESQISVLQAAKDQAAEDARKIIEKLGEQKDQISADAQATIDRLEETKVAIQTAAERQIEQLIKVETEAHLARVRQDDYWQTFLGLTGAGDEDTPSRGGAERRGTAIAPTPTTIPQDTLAEQRRANEKLADLVSQQRDEIDTLRQQVRLMSDAARDNKGLLEGVRVDLATLNDTLRRNGEASRV